MDKNPIRFSRKDSAQFFKTLNKRVNDYFKENNLKKTGNWKLPPQDSCNVCALSGPIFLNINAWPT